MAVKLAPRRLVAVRIVILGPGVPLEPEPDPAQLTVLSKKLPVAGVLRTGDGAPAGARGGGDSLGCAERVAPPPPEVLGEGP